MTKFFALGIAKRELQFSSPNATDFPHEQRPGKTGALVGAEDRELDGRGTAVNYKRVHSSNPVSSRYTCHIGRR